MNLKNVDAFLLMKFHIFLTYMDSRVILRKTALGYHVEKVNIS